MAAVADEDALLNRAIDNLNAALLKDLEKLMLEEDDVSKPSLPGDKAGSLPGLDGAAAVTPARSAAVADVHAPSPQPPSTRVTAAPGIQSSGRRRDPRLMERAQDLGLNLDKFEGKGLEEQAVKQLNDMVD